MTDEYTGITIKVDGELIDIDLAEDLIIRDLAGDMDHVAAKIGHWGDMLGVAEAEKILVDAAYRSWRADFGRVLLATNEKLAEWKVKAAIEASPDFMQHKEKIATAQRNVMTLHSVYEAFRVKAGQLRSKALMKGA